MYGKTNLIPITPAAAGAIAALASGAELCEVALGALRNAVQDGTLTDDARARLIGSLTEIVEDLTLFGKLEVLAQLMDQDRQRAPTASERSSTAAKIEATPEGIVTTLPDARPGFEPHEVCLFRVAPTQGTVRDELYTLLGKDAAERLIRQIDAKTSLDKPLKRSRDVALFLDSNNKPYERGSATPSLVPTTQKEDFRNAGCEEVSHQAALVLCARLVHKAIRTEDLSEAEIEFVNAISQGALRTKHGALSIDSAGNLYDLGRWPFDSFPTHWVLAQLSTRPAT